MTWLVDSHIHLSDPIFKDDIHHIISSMEKLHIKACCVSMDNDSSVQTLNLAKKSHLILPFIGVHPEKYKENLDITIELINQNSDIISGVGEIGLDKTYTSSDEDFENQKQVFVTQLELAEKIKKPVSIHSRKTLDDIYQILPSYDIDGVLLHWFDGSKKQLQKAMDLNCYVSYGPVLIYANDKQVLLSKTDVDKILVETDGPVTFSRCFDSKNAQISFIPSVVFCAAKILRKSYDEFSEILENNSNNYLGV